LQRQSPQKTVDIFYIGDDFINPIEKSCFDFSIQINHF